MNFIKKLFGKKSLWSIEYAARDIDTQIARLIIDAEKKVANLKVALKKNDFSEKDVQSREMRAELIAVVEKIDELLKNMDDIRKMKLEKNISAVPDDTFIQDKLSQLAKMKDSLVELIETLHEEPSDEEFETNVFPLIQRRMKELESELEKLKKDDENLLKIYLQEK